jgi:hypothetical protein
MQGSFWNLPLYSSGLRSISQREIEQFKNRGGK